MPEQALRQYIMQLKAEGSEKAAAGLQRLATQSTRLEKALEQTRQEMLRQRGITQSAERDWEQYGRRAESAGIRVDALRRALRNQIDQARTSKSRIEELAEAYDEAANGADRLNRSASRTSTAPRLTSAMQAVDPRLYGDVESRTRAITGAIGYLGGAGFERTANIGAELLGAAEGIGLLKEELPSLVHQLGLTRGSIVALAAAAAALGTVYLAAKDYIDDLSAAAHNAQIATAGQIEGLRDYYEFIQGATREDVQARFEEVAARHQINRQLYEDLLEIQRAHEEARASSGELNIENLSKGALDLWERVFGGEAGLEEIEQAVAETETQIRSETVQMDLLTQALADGVTAAADRAAADEEYNKRALQGLDARLAQQIEVEQRARDWSSEQARAELENIEIQRTAYARAKEELLALGIHSEEAATQLQAYDDKLYELDQQEAALTNTIIPAIEAREREEAAIEATTKRLTERGEALVALDKKLRANADAARELRTTYDADTERIAAERELDDQRDAEDYLRKRLAARRDLSQDLADLELKRAERQADILEKLADGERDLDEKRLEELRDFAKEDLKRAKDHQKRILEINRDTSKDLEDAVADRNVTAALAALDAQQEQLDAEEDRYREEQEQRAEALQDLVRDLDKERREKQDAARQALRDLQDDIRQERAVRTRAFNDKMRDMEAERRIEQQRLAQDRQIADQARQAHFDAQMLAYTNHYRDIENATAGHLNKMAGLRGGGISTSGRTKTNAADNRLSAIQRALMAGGNTTKFYGDGVLAGAVPPGSIIGVGDGGPEFAQFGTDGAWRIFNNRQVHRLEAAGNVTIGPITIHTPSTDVVAIESVVEQRIIPRITRAVEQARGGYRG